MAEQDFTTGPMWDETLSRLMAGPVLPLDPDTLMHRLAMEIARHVAGRFREHADMELENGRALARLGVENSYVEYHYWDAATYLVRATFCTRCSGSACEPQSDYEFNGIDPPVVEPCTECQEFGKEPADG